MGDYLLQLENVVVDRRTEPTGMLGLWGRKPIRALDGVNLGIKKGETLAVIGGSGAGKSTLLQAATLRIPADRGRIRLNGHDMTRASGDTRRKALRRMPIIAQDPREGLQMDRPVGKQLVHTLKQAGLNDGERRISDAFARVGLTGLEHRAPRELSGGQIQRAVLAAAIAANPAVLACDEPFSGVDQRLQDELCDLIRQLQREKQVGVLLVSHNLRLVHKMADRVAVLYRGHVFETGTPDQILGEPKHPYSTAFLRRSSGLLPPEDDPIVVHAGCPWFPHCKISSARCRTQAPVLREVEEGRSAACHEL